MNRTVLATALLLAGVIAAAALVLSSSEPEPLRAMSEGSDFDSAAGTAERLAALEAAVAEERRARQLLEDELLGLYAEIDSLRASGATEDAATDAEESSADADGPESRAELWRGQARFQSSEEARTAALIAGGFSPDRAEYIRQREDALRVEGMQARFEAQRAGDMEALMQSRIDPGERLREELGDQEYEQYLEAYGRPTSVTIGNVLESSPGAQAGLQRGDEILRYDGQRVFSYSDINEQQLKGTAGETVVVDIRRDGTPMQIVLPRGPIGIEASRRWRR